jgi:hypothetical protein
MSKLGDRKMQKLMQLWRHLVFLYIDEISLANPQLLGALSWAACWGRADFVKEYEFIEHPFGDVLCQLILGDFMQLNPVLSHSLIEAVLTADDPKVPRVPEYLRMDAKQRLQQLELDDRGYKIFSTFLDRVVLFKGSHRFAPGDPLPRLLSIMRTPGGAVVPDDLKALVAARIYLGGDDPRASLDYTLLEPDPHTLELHQVGPRGFFACGFHSAVNWEQVSRMQQLWAVNCASTCLGPLAWQNLSDGKPDVRPVLEQAPGQLIYYVQAVDVPIHGVHLKSPAVFRQALGVANMSSGTVGLISMLPLYLGGRVKLTKKVLAPLLVQEATGEVVGISFHRLERCYVWWCWNHTRVHV